MQVIANGQKIPFNLTEEKNGKEVLQTLLLLTNQANKLIIECKINGEPISLLERDKFAEQPIASIETIEILVEDKTRRVVGCLKEIDGLYTKISEAFTDVSNTLIAGQKHKALNLFSEALDNWRKVINFLRVIETSYKLTFSEIEINGKKVEEANTELFKVLTEIKKAIENEDLVTIGDLVEYELKDKIKEQKNIVTTLQDIIQKEAQKLAQQVP